MPVVMCVLYLSDLTLAPRSGKALVANECMLSASLDSVCTLVVTSVSGKPLATDFGHSSASLSMSLCWIFILYN